MNFYKKERHAQLRRHSAEQLNQMLSMDESRCELGAKRKHEEVDGFSESELPQKRIIVNNNGKSFQYSQVSPRLPSVTNWLPSEASTRGEASIAIQPPMPTPPLSYYQSGTPASLSDAGFLTPSLFSFTHRPSCHSSSYAPIFEDITITPRYDTGPSVYPFPPGTDTGNYSASGRLELSDSVIPLIPDDLGLSELGQVNGGMGAFPY